MHDGLYYLDNNNKHKLNASNLNECNAIMKIKSSPKHLWHLRLGHIAEDKILSSLGSEPNPTCESCLQGKMTKSPFVGQGLRAKNILELIHIDVCGPFKEMARGGF